MVMRMTRWMRNVTRKARGTKRQLTSNVGEFHWELKCNIMLRTGYLRCTLSKHGQKWLLALISLYHLLSLTEPSSVLETHHSLPSSTLNTSPSTDEIIITRNPIK